MLVIRKFEVVKEKNYGRKLFGYGYRYSNIFALGILLSRLGGIGGIVVRIKRIKRIICKLMGHSD